MHKTTIGIDNGVSGSIGIIQGDDSYFCKTPTIISNHYSKSRGNFTRIDYNGLCSILKDLRGAATAWIERPMVNPARFRNTESALRAYEATILALERFNIGYDTVDSKKWQKAILGAVKGPALKTASASKGSQLYPQFANDIKENKDADGLLIAHYYHYL